MMNFADSASEFWQKGVRHLFGSLQLTFAGLPALGADEREALGDADL